MLLVLSAYLILVLSNAMTRSQECGQPRAHLDRRPHSYPPIECCRQPPDEFGPHRPAHE